MFGFGKKKVKEDKVDLNSLQVVNEQKLEQIKAEIQAKKDAEQDALIKELKEKINKQNKTISELKEADKVINSSDTSQNAKLKELSKNYVSVKNKLDSLDVRTQVVIKNIKTVKTQLSRVNINNLPFADKQAFEKAMSVVDGIIEKFKN